MTNLHTATHLHSTAPKVGSLEHLPNITAATRSGQSHQGLPESLQQASLNTNTLPILQLPLQMPLLLPQTTWPTHSIKMSMHNTSITPTLQTSRYHNKPQTASNRVFNPIYTYTEYLCQPTKGMHYPPTPTNMTNRSTNGL